MSRQPEHRWVEVTEDPLDPAGADRFLRTPACGAVCTFLGTTRAVTDGRVTERLDYEAYVPMAVEEMNRLADGVEAAWDVHRLVVHHRIGTVPPAEASVLVGVATPHRDDAFQAARALIDRLKMQVPIWKKERYADGTTEWVQGDQPPAPR